MIENLKYQLSKPLPGRPAQYKMAHAVRVNYPPAPVDARVACVLTLLYPKNNDWHIVLIERMSTHKNDRHSGQISFPGGGLEASDATLAAGALREANEEVGVITDDIELLGQLTEMYIPVSNFLVHPFVGKLDYTPTFIPQPSEVKSILEVPLTLLQDPKTTQTKHLKLSEQITLKNVPYYSIQNHIVWGATAMMLSEFLEVIKESK
jgi:8-oxo-dGTP pyrophosphatase MutT (NUDIX family)